MTVAIVRELVRRQNGDGGWGAVTGGPSNSECTALACLALMQQSANASGPIDAGITWLAGRQVEGGGWRYSDDGPITTWPTPIVLLALRTERRTEAAVAAGYAWLLSTRGERIPWRARFRQFLSGQQVIELDSTLDGWPWVPGTFSWVEPTSWALMALKAYDAGRATRPVRRRIRDGERMLIDRACVGGGWNYGNRRVYDEDLPAYPDTSALALLGLRGLRDPAVEAGFAALDGLLDAQASGLALALGLLSRRAWRRDPADLAERLAQRYEAGFFRDDQRTLALAALSLAPQLDWLGVASHA
jgi:hypothetical protein